YIVSSCLLVGMGVVDDVKSLGWKTKFAGMAAAATTVIFGGNIVVHSLGTYGPLGQINLGWFSVPFTYIGIIGITNAINLLDGLNGLAGGVSLLGFLFMGIAAALTGNYTLALVCFAFVGALGAFLLYNFPNARIFMGDSGSLFLGFSLSLTAVLLTQGSNTSVDSMFPVLVLLLPIFDTIRVLTVRIMNGKNPFHGDNLHLHFLIMGKNISPVYVTLLFWSFTALFGGVALSLTSGNSISYLNVVLFASSFLSLIAAGLTRGGEHLATQNRAVSMSAAPSEFTGRGSAVTGFNHKEGVMAVKLMVIMGVLLLAAQAIPEETTVLKTQKDKVNYAIGVNMIGNFKQQGIEIDLDLVTRGMKDALSGEKLLLPDEELRKAIDQYQIAVRQKRSQMMAKTAEENKKEGEAFLTENQKKEGVVTLPSGLQYKVLKEGDGRKPTDADTVECNYRGTLVNGTEFDNSYRTGKPAMFKVSGVIPGWAEALKLMPVGSKWQLFVPSGIAYGEKGKGIIGPNATLIFEVELVAVK
ncbi:MAG: FKBP-type peptidyl-prolyl cis-trans isomerase N-terminal domain-containing protein, partial [Desulfuromonadaceae bacterium]